MQQRNATEIASEVNSLANSWQLRESKFRDWYKLIRLDNNLAQDKMESVISADPRTGFGMALWLLEPRVSAFVLDTYGMEESEQKGIGVIEQYADRQLLSILKASRTSLHGPAIRRMISLMLATGWYSVISFPTERSWHLEVWNPAQVYPEYGTDGELIRLGRRYRCSAAEANAKCLAAMQDPMSGWQMPGRKFDMSQTVYNLWRLQDGTAWHAVVIGTELVKPMQPTVFDRIPVLCGPVGGLPDDGSIMQDDTWKATVGESVIGPILDVQQNYNKMLTYMQQLMRDTANPKWVEEVREKGVVQPETLYNRGVVYSIEPGEKIYPLSTPPLPAEMRGHLFELRGQVQRGMFSDIAFGNIQGQMSGFLMSQVTASAKKTLQPFYVAVRDILGEIATRNLTWQRAWKWKLGDTPWPNKVPDKIMMDFRYDIEIPGDFIQRANSAKVLNPNFTISETSLMEILFPEIQNSVIEQSKVRAEEAQRNPLFAQVMIVSEFRKAAREANQNGDVEMEQLLQRVADIAEAQLQPQQPQQPPMRGPSPNAVPPTLQEVFGGNQS